MVGVLLVDHTGKATKRHVWCGSDSTVVKGKTRDAVGVRTGVQSRIQDVPRVLVIGMQRGVFFGIFFCPQSSHGLCLRWSNVRN